MIKRPSKLEIRTKIKQLNRLDLERANYNHIIRILRQIIPQVPVIIGKTKSTELFFRVRKSNSVKLNRIEELQAPPASLVTGFQRCNGPEQPMFYSASKRITALLECNVTAGDTVYLSQWVCREPMPINRLLATEDDPEFIDGLTELDLIVHSYFDTLFTRRVHEDFSSSYKLTAAATEVLTTKFNPNPDQDIREDRMVGIVYPAVAHIDHSYNTALHPEFASKRLELLHVMELTILSRTDKTIEIEITDNAIEFIDGKILWLGNKNNAPTIIEDRNRLSFISTGRSWVIPVRNEAMSPLQMTEFLNE